MRRFSFPILISGLILLIQPIGFAQTASGPAVFSGLFGSRELERETPNNPGNNYEMLLHINDPGWYEDELAYNPDRGFGFEEIFPDNFDQRNGAGVFGPFDDSPNNRNNFADELYNSFIGFKSHPDTCDEFLFDPESRTSPCSLEIEPSGGIFRVDVPNGTYAFVGAFGDSQHNHAHRVLVEDGGEGIPDEIGDNHVVLVGNHNQPDYVRFANELTLGRGGVEGANLAVVGFGDHLPPAPEGPEDEHPLFVYYDNNGEPLIDDEGAPLGLDEATPSSPVLEVTKGYVRLHLLQGNSNPFIDEDEGIDYPRDANGADVILFEIIPVTDGDPCDFDGSGALDIADVDLLSAAIQSGAGDLGFDVNGDGALNAADLAEFITSENKMHTYIGDANLDGEFNSGDFVGVFQAGKFETGDPATWSQGDWNADGVFTSGDFVAAFQDGGFELGPRWAEGVAGVPEPSEIALVLLGCIGLLARRRRS